MSTSHEDISLVGLMRNIWRAKIYMLISVILCFVMAWVYIMTTPSQYKAQMIVAPADGYALGDYASSVQYDDIAALPFWRPKDQEGASTDFYRFMHTIRGAVTAQLLLKDQEFIQKFDKERLKTPEFLSQYLHKNIRIDPLGATPLRRITYHHEDPELAKALLRKMHLVADQLIRRDRRKQSSSRIEYLTKALQGTANIDHRRMITNLLMQQEHIQMLANLDEAYAAIMVEPPHASPRPVYPNSVFIFAVALLLGMIFGYSAYYVRHDE